MPAVFGHDLRPWQRKIEEIVDATTTQPPSSLSKQILSHQKNSVHPDFGSSTREDWSKIGSQPDTNSNVGPGQYKSPFSMGKQPESHKRTSAGTRFGTSQRKLPPMRGYDQGLESPGPIYSLKSSIGGGRISFGQSKRPAVATNSGHDSPGPIYTLPSYLGQSYAESGNPNNNGKKKNSTFGTSLRELPGGRSKERSPGPIYSLKPNIIGRPSTASRGGCSFGPSIPLYLIDAVKKKMP